MTMNVKQTRGGYKKVSYTILIVGNFFKGPAAAWGIPLPAI